MRPWKEKRAWKLASVRGSAAALKSLGVPAQRGVQPVKAAGTRHIDLSAAAGLFCWAAEELDRTRAALPVQEILHSQRRTDGADTQEIMSAAMPIAVMVALHRRGVLPQSGQRIIFRQDADHRCACAVGSRKRRRQFPGRLLHPEALLLQQVLEHLC